MGTCAFVSFRLGLADGVSAVARLWEQSIRELGWHTVTVAGDGPVDRVVPQLGIGAGVEIPESDSADAAAELRSDLTAALADADVVVAENILSIPLNLSASRALADVLAGRPALLHHHDPPWQRQRFAHVTELPPDDPAWRHVTINRLTEQQFNERGFQCTTIYNGFDTSPDPGDRAATRRRLGVADGQLLFAHPVRAIARKNVPKALELAEKFGAAYWLPGPAEEGYQATLDELISQTDCPVLRTPIDHRCSISDLYAAADCVVFPSTWEGFGNPPIEAAIHGLPAVVGRYPVAEELRRLGFRWPDPDDDEAIGRALEAERLRRQSAADDRPPPAADVAHNQSLIERHFTLDATTTAIAEVFDQAGWRP